MPSTPIYGLPYPDLSEPPNGPTQIEALAEAVEAELARIDADIADVIADVKPYARLRQTVAQSIANATYTAVTFTTEDYDSAGGHSTSSNTSRYTAQVAGAYVFGGGGAFAVNAAGTRSSRWALNGTAIPGSTSPGFDPSITSVVVARPLVVQLGVGDYVELQLRQSSGGSLNTSVTSDDQSTMSVWYVSP